MAEKDLEESHVHLVLRTQTSVGFNCLLRTANSPSERNKSIWLAFCLALGLVFLLCFVGLSRYRWTGGYICIGFHHQTSQ